ncbi:DUF3717 domain-containing protein [Paraburkholderia rhizosphaerae]|uniref:Uncharacterized protein DUF3717 n=1 Tax=Paraburkholderia rhizosphaerae TaxID=480658 RepID=A0A4R8LPR3_9BURK|nr:DUF3717 domain-containing protein [Paraburkholderia rhizosphaerae]TDY48317.1 uncharacterized protein DUF3717 [Paraburkholderia rhizosphaerae]
MNQLATATQVVSIAQIEAAINAWRNRTPVPAGQNEGEAIVLCAEARSLADVYGGMIFSRQQQIPLSALSSDQVAALAIIG